MSGRRTPAGSSPRSRAAVVAVTLLASLSGCASPRASHGVVPRPSAVEIQPSRTFTVDTSTTVAVTSTDPDAVRVARWLAELVGGQPATTRAVLLPGDPGAASADVRLALAPDPELGAEGYQLTVGEEGIVLLAPEPAGLFRGLQTLRMLLPAAVEHSAAFGRSYEVPWVRVRDRPRFEWRGAMLDVARHFFGVEEVKRFVDLLALHKMNRLHLHLSDDQGWRIEIPSWPRLTEVGGSTEVGGGPGGFYTTEEYREIVEYAAERFVTVVPEIDMPGHTNAALASYAELDCDGVAPPLYTGTRVGFSALCVDREVTWRFLDDVVGEIAALTPGEWFHVGGDEVERLSDDEYRRFVERAAALVRAHGKTMVGWGEVAAADLPSSAVVQLWRPGGASARSAGDAAARGHRLILSPADRVYLDMKYGPETALGLSWAGFTDLREAYGWDPAGLLPGVPEALILGVEATLWSETLATMDEVEHMALPRLAAVAELGWSTGDADWDDFRLRLAEQRPRWSALGVNARLVPGVPWR